MGHWGSRRNRKPHKMRDRQWIQERKRMDRLSPRKQRGRASNKMKSKGGIQKKEKKANSIYKN